MFLDHDHWGRDESFFIVEFQKDRYIGPLDQDLKPLFVEENWTTETRFIEIYCESIRDTLNFDEATIFPNRHNAVMAIQAHREKWGDRGRVYDIRTV